MLIINKGTQIAKDLREPYNAREFKVGDIIEASFQYSAKIPYFYEIVRKTAATIYCKRLNKRPVSTDGCGQNGYCIPVLNSYHSDKLYAGRINKRSGHVRINDCLASLWNGNPVDFYSD